MTLKLQDTYDIIQATGDMKQMTLQEILSLNTETLLYFYPKDNTPGCTVENKDFSSLKQEFEQNGVALIWVSRDSIESHQKFIDQQELKNDLISDPDLQLHKQLWAYGEKNNYWKIVTWVIRSTFLLNSEGSISESWKNIRAKGHAQRVLKEIQAL